MIYIRIKALVNKVSDQNTKRILKWIFPWANILKVVRKIVANEKLVSTFIAIDSNTRATQKNEKHSRANKKPPQI